MTKPATLRKLADRVELLGAAESGRALDHDIARAIRGKESIHAYPFNTHNHKELI